VDVALSRLYDAVIVVRSLRVWCASGIPSCVLAGNRSCVYVRRASDDNMGRCRAACAAKGTDIAVWSAMAGPSVIASGIAVGMFLRIYTVAAGKGQISDLLGRGRAR